MNFKTIKHIIIDYIGITMGIALIAVGLTVFLIPNQIVAGGISGLATVIYYLFNFPVGVIMLAINIPIFIISLKTLGFSFIFRTLYGIIILSLLIDLFQYQLVSVTEDLLLASIYGGVLIGTGLGTVFHFRGTTGGTDMVAKLISHFSDLSLGKSLLIADGTVVALAAIFFNFEVALYATITIFIVSKTIDMIQEGLGISKMVFIISEKSNIIKDTILHDFDRGLTSFKGQGGFSGEDKEILMCIISRSEISRLKKKIYDIDNNAFVTINNVNEVLGEGFKDVKKN